MTEPTTTTWRYASLTLAQPRWPGVAAAEWVARVGGVERFRTTDVAEAMDRLGRDGWELVVLFPEAGDRSASFYFKAPGAGPA